jgi:hypothetical protein
MRIDPDWTAPRVGYDWRDDELMLAVTWLKSFVPHREVERRIDGAKAYLAAPREQMREGVQAPLFDPTDTAAWYILQAETFATDRLHWTTP